MHISSHIHHHLNLVQNIQKEVLLFVVMILLVMLKNSGGWVLDKLKYCGQIRGGSGYLAIGSSWKQFPAEAATHN